MAGFDVTDAQMLATAAELGRVQENVRAQQARLSGEVEALLAGGWVGGAASGFARGWREWSVGADEVLQALAATAQLLAASGRGYESAETANTSVVRAPEAGL